MRILHAAVAIACLAGTVAHAQRDDPLRGPDVAERDTRTLVGRTMTGAFVRVEGRPEVAAANLLDLDDETRARVDAIVDDRAMALRMLLVDEIDTVRDITDAMTEGDRDRAAALSDRLHRAMDADTPRDPLLEPIAAVLPDDRAAELRRLVDEYWSAWIGAAARRAETPDETTDRLGAQLFQREVREAYDASLRRYRDALEAIYQAVEPTPEQRAAIRELVIEHIRATRLDATPAQRRDAMLRIYQLLDDERQERLFAYMTSLVVTDG